MSINTQLFAQARKAKGLTQADIVRKFAESGVEVTASTVSQWANGRGIAEKNAIILAEMLGVSVDSLVVESTESTESTDERCVIRWRGAEMTYFRGMEMEAAKALALLVERTANLPIGPNQTPTADDVASGAMLVTATAPGKPTGQPPSV